MGSKANLKVLFLDDDADTRELVKYTLKQAEIDVSLAATVPDAWHITLSEEISLFLLDGLIPNGDAFKLCRDVRMIEPVKPILFYSGLAAKTDIERGIQAGADGYLTKPFRGNLALELLRYIDKKKSSESLGERTDSIIHDSGKGVAPPKNSPHHPVPRAYRKFRNIRGIL